MEVVTSEPSMNIDWTFPVDTIFTPPSVTMYGTQDEVYTVTSIDREPIACCDVVYYHTSVTEISMLSVVEVFTHWVETHFEIFTMQCDSIPQMIASGTTQTKIFSPNVIIVTDP